MFDFTTFLVELKANEEKKELVEKYEKFYGELGGTIKDQARYKEYVINFKVIPYAVPDEIKDEFDWALLLQLVASSFSSSCVLEKPLPAEGEELPENPESVLQDLVISVSSGDQSVVKKVSELRSFQVMKLYEIYIEEQMNLQVLTKEDENEAQAIMSQRQHHLQTWRNKLEVMNREELVKEAAAEKETQLDDLYAQL